MLTLLGLQFKRAWKTLPKLLLGAILPILLTGMAVFYSKHRGATEASGSFISPVALVNYDDKADLDFMLPYFSNIDATSGFSFVEMEEAEAMSALKSGEVCAVLVFPPNMLEGIINSTNTPAKLYLPDNNSIASLLIGKFAEAGSLTLGSAQADVYAASDLYREYNLKAYEDDIVLDINLATLHYSLARESLFTTRSVSLTGSLSLLQYYAATAFLFLLVFLSAGMGSYLCNATGTTLYEQFRRNGIGILRYEFSLFLPLFLLYLLLTCGLFSVLQRFLTTVSLNRTNLCFLLLTAFCLTMLVQLIYRVFSDTGRGILVFLFSGLMMIFLAGGLLPYAFLPAVFQKIAVYLPLGSCLIGLRHLTAGVVTTSDLVGLLFHSAILCLLFLFVCFLRNRKGALA